LEMLETFGMHKGGKEYRRLIAAFERIFGATIFFGTDGFQGKAKVVHRSRFNLLREAQIWYSRNADQPVLSDEFAQRRFLSRDHCPSDTDLDAVRVLAPSPAVLDLLWLSYRCFSAKGEESIPLWQFWARGSTWKCRGRPATTVSREVGAVAKHDPRDVAGMSRTH
jgi:hypothetical protein